MTIIAASDEVRGTIGAAFRLGDDMMDLIPEPTATATAMIVPVKNN